MTEATLPHFPDLHVEARPRRTKFLVGGLIILGAVIYLVVATISGTAQYFLTVNELWAMAATLNGRAVRVSGQVIGSSIQVNEHALTVSFQIVDDEAAPDRPLTVTYAGPKPDTLREEAAAIVEGQLGEEGIFYADNVLFKCPSRYEEGKEETWSLKNGAKGP